MQPRVNIADVLINNIDRAGAMEQIESFVESDQPRQIVTVNLNFVTIALRNPTFKQLINSADLAVPDGMPLLWASRFLGNPLIERVTGIDLVHSCLEVSARKGYSVFLLGGEPGVARKAAEVLLDTYKGLGLVGSYSPPFGSWSQEEDEMIVQLVKEVGPHFLFVCLGCPKQEFWIQDHKHELGARVSIGVGCAFDLLAGRYRRAPQWMQDSGLEWLFRLSQEPGRLWRRYLNDVPTFFRVMAWRFQQNGRGT